MTVGQRIHDRRKELKLTLKDIFEAENIKTGNLSELENDKYLPSVQTLIALARVLNCSIDWLLTGSEHKSLNNDISEIRTLKVEQGLLCDGSPLDDDEADIIAMYRLLSKVQRHELYDFVYFKYQREVERGRGSTYSGSTSGRKGQSGPGEDRDSCTETA